MTKERETILTTCTRDCPDTCGITAHVSCDRVVALAGVRDHEITGLFLCRKSSRMVERVYSHDRILKPLKQVNGEWQEVSWSTALDEIAQKTKDTIEKHGSTAILHYQSAGSVSALKMLNKRFFNLLGGVTEASGSLCGGAGAAGQIMDFGRRTCHDPLDHRNSRLILLWGRNPADTNLHLLPILKEAQSNGARVILIDPLATDTEKFADKHIKPTPGADGYLAMGMAKIILESGWQNQEFIDTHCYGFNEYKEMLDGHSLKSLSKQSGIAVDEMRQLAEMYANIKPAAIICGWGLQRYQWGAETFRLIDSLAAITGNIGIPGGGVNHGKDGFEFFNEAVKGKKFAKNTRTISKPLFAQEIAKLNDPPVKMAFINGANPVNQSPDANAAREALKQVETVVVFEQFMTDTAELADYVLPVTTFLEETDVVASYWHNIVGPVNPVIKPQGEARSDLHIYQELAERLDIGDGMRGTPDEWMERIIKPLTLQGMSLERIKNKHRRVPFAETIAFEDANYKTEDRRIHLINSFEVKDFTTRKYPFRLLTVHARNSIHSQIIDSGENEQEIEAIVHPRTAKSSRLEERDRARLVSPAGEMNVIVRLDFRMKEDVVAIKQGGWIKRGKSANQLTSVLIGNFGESACYYQTPVRLERL